MEYENMRIPELKSLTREHRLRNYSLDHKSKANLINGTIG